MQNSVAHSGAHSEIEELSRNRHGDLDDRKLSQIHRSSSLCSSNRMVDYSINLVSIEGLIEDLIESLLDSILDSLMDSLIVLWASKSHAN